METNVIVTKKVINKNYRLATLKELEMLSDHIKQHDLKDAQEGFYWSSTLPLNAVYAFAINLQQGKTVCIGKTDQNFVCLVKEKSDTLEWVLINHKRSWDGLNEFVEEFNSLMEI